MSAQELPKFVEIYDTTLRDGTQMEGISLSAKDKLRIARRLDAFGVAYIEAGWPGSNPKDREVFAQLAEHPLQNSVVTAFGSTRRANCAASDDSGLLTQLAAETTVCTIFGKSSKLHTLEVLRTTLEENLRMIDDSVRFLVSSGRRVFFDAEHFFDGYALDASYAMATLQAARAGGAEVLVLCDTNGGSLPWQVSEIVAHVVSELRGVRIGIHTHDDAGCGVANALAAITSGARHVQGTINGYGERCGNANLCSIIPCIELKMGLTCVAPERLKSLGELSRFVSEVANFTPNDHQPFVGKSAFAHKGGIHVAAIRREATSYNHIDPIVVGNSVRVVVSELAGKGSVLSKAEEFSIELPKGADEEIVATIKELESQGASFESAEASVEILLRRKQTSYIAPFRLVDYHVMVGHRDVSGTFAEAMVKIVVGDKIMHTAAEGTGPVGALDEALRKALEPYFPEVRAISLVDYKVRIVDERAGTAATIRVITECRKGATTWSTVGASSNVIEASWTALADAIEYGLMLPNA